MTPGIAPSCSLRYATAFACCGLRTSREPNEASATMWSLSLAGSMPSSTAAIGLGVGAGVGRAVAVGIALTAAADDTGGDGNVEPAPQDASTIVSATRCGRTTPVYRGRDRVRSGPPVRIGGGPASSGTERSLVSPFAPCARGRGLASAVRRGPRGLLLRVLLAPEDDLAVLRVNQDRVALFELSREDLLRERIDDEALDRALDRARAIDRIESLFGDERFRVVR